VIRVVIPPACAVARVSMSMPVWQVRTLVVRRCVCQQETHWQAVVALSACPEAIPPHRQRVRLEVQFVFVVVRARVAMAAALYWVAAAAAVCPLARQLAGLLVQVAACRYARVIPSVSHRAVDRCQYRPELPAVGRQAL